MTTSLTGVRAFDATVSAGPDATPEQQAARRRLDVVEADLAVARLELKLADSRAYGAPAQQLANLEQALAGARQEAARLTGRAEEDC